MLTREQVYTMLMLRNRENTIFSLLPNELICYISNVNMNTDNNINEALRLAASGLEDDLIKLESMVEENPRLLLQAANVITRSGIHARRTTLYEFFLAEGDPDGAKRIQFGFRQIRNGDNERLRQYERYRPYIESLEKSIKSNKPSFDLTPLFNLIMKSSPDTVAAALNKDMTQKSTLNSEMQAFRNAVRPINSVAGMHYAHYITLLQALNLLYANWKELSHNHQNYDKCFLVWRQIVGYLERSLPTIDRIAFARAFTDSERTLKFRYSEDFFPDCLDTNGDLEHKGLGFDEAIYGRTSNAPWILEVLLIANVFGNNIVSFGRHLSEKIVKLAELMPAEQKHRNGCAIC